MKYIRFISRSGEKINVMFEGGDLTHAQMAALLGAKVFSAGYLAVDNPKVRVSGFVPSLEVCSVPSDAYAFELAFRRAAALYPPTPEATAAATYPWPDTLSPEEKAAIDGTKAPAGPFPVSTRCSCQGCGMQFETPMRRQLCAACETLRYESR